MREDADDLDVVRLLRLHVVDFRRLGDEEENPNRSGDRRGIEIREDELLRKEDSREGPNRIEHLREVEPSTGSS